MNILKARTLASKATDNFVKTYYDMIAKSGQQATITGDNTPIIRLPASKLDELSALQAQEVQARYTLAGIDTETPIEAYKGVQARILGDSQLVNPKNKVGTLIDPSVYTHSNIPIMMGPYEGSSIYANGGLPTDIINKKARGMVIQGATFKGMDNKFWNSDKLQRLEEAAAITGFNDTISDASCDSFIYGGAITYPVFKRDTPGRMLTDIDKLGLEKGCIDRWVSVDRWNTMIVPSYVVTAKDYLKPHTLYVPMSSLELNTTRVALLKPRPIPYWVALYNIGWAPSDFTGWLRSYYGYAIVCQSIPVMAQQMSLVLYKMPLDALQATIGPDKVRELMEINEEKMSEWSALSPKAVNMVGEVEVVDRTYSGFEQFVGAMKSDLASSCGIPEPSLWHTPNKGFSDNTTESLLKQSETLRMLQRFLERSMPPCTEALIAHVFGQDSEEWRRRDEVQMTFNKPVISTEKDLAEVGARFAASVSSFVQAGVRPDTALQLSSQFFPTVKVTEEMLADARKSYEDVMEKQNINTAQGLGPQAGNKQLGGGQGNTKGAKTTTGAFTKAK